MPLPPGPVRRHDPAVGQDIAQERDVDLPTDEGRDVARQVGRRIHRAEGARVVGSAGHDQQVESGRLLEVLDRAETLVGEGNVAEARRGRQAADGRARARASDRTIWPPLPSGRDPGRVIHVDPDVILRVVGGASVAKSTLRPGGAPSVTRSSMPSAHALAGDGPLPRGRGRHGVLRADANAAKKASPSVLTTAPP